jgi:hypothetical protein
MKLDRLLALYPRLYHMAQEGSWPAISRHGLMTTKQLVDASSLPANARSAITGQRRSKSLAIECDGLGAVVIRDQAPLREQFLADSLTDGMTEEQWLKVLNNRVFFWLHPGRLAELLNARRYRNHAHDVIVVDTASLVAAHADRIRLSAINSGATLYPNAPERGPRTFMPIAEYPYEERRSRGVRGAIAELAVIDGVPDIVRHTVRVERRQQDETLGVLYHADTS